MKKTKIVCTLGPASSSEAVMEKMILAGMNVARLNFSHGDHEAHRKTIETFRKVRDNLGLPAAVLLDTKGPEIRLGLFENDSVILENGQTFTLTPDDIMGNIERCSITYKKLATQVGAGTNILIDDGRVSLKVTELKGKDVVCKVTHGGKISNRKGVNVPKTHLDLEYLSPDDKKDLLFGIEMDVDYIAASFVRTAEDVIDLRNFLNNNGGQKIKIISKIENIEGIENFSRILKHSNGIMVARGDMGVEVNYAKLPGLQKKLIRECRKAGKLVITATQMLESMVASPTPTRAEITDVANAVFDGTSAVMLSGESAMGKYPVETVKVMAKILKQAEKDAFAEGLYKATEYELDTKDVSSAIGHAACHASEDLKAKAILAITTSGNTAERMAKFRPVTPIVAPTPTTKTYHQLALSWGIYPVLTTYTSDWDDLFKEAIDGTKKMGLVKERDTIVVTAGLPLHTTGATNMVRVETVE